MFTKEGKLDIFENFRVDFELPKFWKARKRGGGSYDDKIARAAGTFVETTEEDLNNPVQKAAGSMSRQFINPRNFRLDQMVESANESFGVAMSGGSYGRKGFWHRLWNRLFDRKPKEPKPMISVEEFFASIKNSVEEMSIVENRAAGYVNMLEKARDTGQVALFEELSKSLVAVRSETQLVAMKMVKYLEEAVVVEFAKQADKGVRLDWVANFTRQVPDVLKHLKLEADERGVFDNYVVMHYDPQKKSWKETEAEKNKRRDPILFGVMEGRRRLYYIGDWVDEICDLTLDQIADKMGKGVVKEIS